MMPDSLALLFASSGTETHPPGSAVDKNRAVRSVFRGHGDRRVGNETGIAQDSKVGAALGWDYRRTGTLLSAPGLTGFPFAGLPTGEVIDEISGVWRDRPARLFVLKDAPPGYSTKFQLTMLWMPAPMPPIEFHPRSNLQRNFDIESEVTTDSARVQQTLARDLQ